MKQKLPIQPKCQFKDFKGKYRRLDSCRKTLALLKEGSVYLRTAGAEQSSQC